MRSNSGLARISPALAVAFLLVSLLASGSAAAATNEPPDALPVDSPVDVIDSDEIGDPVDSPVDVIDSDEIGDEGGSESDEAIDVVAPELPPDTDEPGDDGNSVGEGARNASEVSRDQDGGSGGGSAAVREVPLARTGYAVLPLAFLGVLSLAAGLYLLTRRRV